jgi:multiple sugar transport system substrate-binding protein
MRRSKEVFLEKYAEPIPTRIPIFISISEVELCTHSRLLQEHFGGEMIAKRITWFSILLVLLSLTLAACGGSPAAPATPAATGATTVAPAADAKIKVDIFVGLGTGTAPDQITAQEALARKFNSTHDTIQIEFVIVPNDEAVQRLLAQVAGGNPPGLVGPGGVDVAASFSDILADVQPFINAEQFDTSDFYGAAVDLYQFEDKTVGLPLGMFPSFIFYNKDLFDAAGVPYPTSDYSDTSWNLDALREMALQLTLDANGNSATSPDFNPNNIVQFGFDDSWTDFRGFMTRFDPPGAGRPTSEDMRTALVNSDEYKYGLAWLNNAIWVDRFMADSAGQEAFYAVGGDPFGGGLTAMFYSHTWFMPEGLIDLPFDYDFAASPFSQKGTRVARIHADTFYILDSYPHKEAAWEVMKWLTSEENIVEVCLIYGCLPARRSVADDYTDQMQSRYGDHNYDVIFEAIGYLDDPHHESWMPNVDRANDVLGADIYDLVFTSRIPDTDAVLENANSQIQAIFDAYWAGR